MQIQKRILISPLNWGLGHATRCIPITRLLIQKNAQVIIAAEAGPLAILKQEFPDLTCIPFEGPVIKYPKNGSMVLKMLFSMPKIVGGIFKEHQQLKKIIKEHQIDIVISDNRYGLWNKKIKSIFISHQLFIKSPFAEKFIQSINLFFIRKFDECWIPDHGGALNLSGDLAHKEAIPESAFFIGPLSRFQDKNGSGALKTNYDVMAIVSGPEPQRSIFEKLIVRQLQHAKLKSLVVCGKPDVPFKKECIHGMELVSHLNTLEMQKAIQQSQLIISRSGYSTIMDLASLKKKCVFIPTPGQTEQAYLAGKFMDEKIAFAQQQDTFDLEVALKESKNYSGFEKTVFNASLIKRVEALLQP